MPLHCCSSAHYTFPLPPGHRFPIEKYALIRDQLVREQVIPADHVHDPDRAAVIDLDVHQGNGTHAIFADDPDVYTFSVHGRKNYPFHKVPGTLDGELDDGVGDDEYLTTLAAHLPRVLAAARPDLVFYLAGSDPHEGDRLGRMCLTFDGLMRRDALVLDTCREVGFPVVITVAGGYGRDIQTTVDVHVNTVCVANRYI